MSDPEASRPVGDDSQQTSGYSEQNREVASSTKQSEENVDKEALKASLNSTSEVGATNYNTSGHQERANRDYDDYRDRDRRRDDNEKKAGEGEEGNTIPNKIFAGGISWSTTEEGLKGYFSKFGEVESVDVMRNPVDNQPRGFAFITFKEAKGVEEACKQHMHDIDGKNVEVKYAFKKHEDREGGVLPAKLFIGGITPSTREPDLEEYFSKFGKLSACVVMLDSNTGRGRGFGFVTFENKEDAEKILQTNDHVIRGKMVDVKIYKSRPNDRRDRDRFRQGGGGGHMGGGGGMMMGMQGGYGMQMQGYGGYGGGGYGMYGGGGGYGGYGGGGMYGGYAGGGYGQQGGYGGGYGGYGGAGRGGGGYAGGGYGQGQGGQYGQGQGGYGQDASGGAAEGYPAGQGNAEEGGGNGAESYGQQGGGGGGGGGYPSQRQQQRESRYKPY